MSLLTNEERKNFKTTNLELEPFDLTKLDKIERVHPFHQLMFEIYKYSPYMEDGHLIDQKEEYGKDLIWGFKYFEMLDNFYRYGIGFDTRHALQTGNKLFIVTYYDKDGNEDKYFIYGKNFCIPDYKLKGLKVINLSDIDNGKKELSEIEKWKRKVIMRKQSLKNRLSLIYPGVYKFFLFKKIIDSKRIDHYLIDYYLSYDGIEDLLEKKLKNNYNELRKEDDYYYINVKKDQDEKIKRIRERKEGEYEDEGEEDKEKYINYLRREVFI